MADMIARQNISGPDGRIPEVDDLRPANQREGSPNQPPAEMREKSLHVGLGGHPGEQDRDSIDSPRSHENHRFQ